MAWSCRDSLLREELHRKTSHIYVKPHPLHGLIHSNRRYFRIELFHEELADRIYDMKLREDDIWILSYPKCGTTWAIETVWLVMNDVRIETANCPQMARVPWVESYAMIDHTLEDTKAKTVEMKQQDIH